MAKPGKAMRPGSSRFEHGPPWLPFCRASCITLLSAARLATAMAALTFYHKPTCSKSREMKRVLDDAGVGFDTVLYIEEPPSRTELERIADGLEDATLADLMRPKEAKEAGWNGDASDRNAVLSFLCEHPEALQRPIVVKGARAIIGRPTENVERFL